MTIPRRVGRFEVREKLGAGAFGVVYRAFDPRLDREVALKVPHAGTLDSPKRRERFLREAKAAANLRHPSIVPVHEAGEDAGTLYIASGFVAGQPLADAVEEGGNDFRQAAAVVRDLADAVAYAHSEGVVHRDIKPANVLLDEQGRPHLLDFGLAARQDEAAKLTNDGAILGTPSYMAPEAAAGQQGDADPAVDQYALGVTLYELLTGQTPFEGPPELVLYHNIHTAPPPPRSRRPYTPRDLETVCLRCLEKDPTRRYPSCRELADDLRRWLDGEPIAARRRGPVERAVRLVRRNPAWSLAAVVVIVCAALVGVVASVSLGQVAVFRSGQSKAEKAAEESAAAARAAEAREAERVRAAERERDAAKVGRAAAEEKARQAEDRARKAEADALREAEKARQAEKAAADLSKARRAAYTDSLAAAMRAFDAGDRPAMRAALDACPPKFRGWEHAHADRLCADMPLRLCRHPSPAHAVAWSADGKRIVSADATSIHVRDAATGKEVLALTELASAARPVALSPDGRRLLTADLAKGVEVRDTATGKVLLTARPAGEVYAVAFSPDGTQFASAGAGKDVILWDAETGEERFALRGHPEAVRVLAFSPDGRRLASGGDEQAVRLWDARRGAQEQKFPADMTVGSLAFSHDGTRLARVSAFGGAAVHDAATGKAVWTLDGQGWPTRAGSFSGDDRRLLLAGGGNWVQVWDASTGKQLLNTPNAHKEVVTAAFSPDGESLLVADPKGWVAVRAAEPVPDAPRFSSLSNGSSITAAAVSADAQRVAALSSDRIVRVRDTRPGERGFDGRLGTATRSPGGLALSSDGRMLAVGDGREIYLWDADAGKPLPMFASPKDAVTALAFSPDGSRLATASKDETVHVWGTADQPKGLAKATPVMSVKNRVPTADSVAFSPDGKRLVTGHRDNTARVWDAATGDLLLTLQGHRDPVVSAVYSPDSKRLATASRDGTARLWNAATGREIAVLIGHPSPIWSVAFSPDGKRLVSGGEDKTLRFWDGEDGRHLMTLTDSTGPVKHVAFSADGRLLACAASAFVRLRASAPAPDPE